MSMYCPTKDRIPILQKANLIYELTCPGCDGKYVGKTDRNLDTRLEEHGSRLDQPMNIHLRNCSDFHELMSFFGLPSNDNYSVPIDFKEHIKTAVINNYRILQSNDSWSTLSFLEAYYIKRLNPVINKGLKASKEL